MQDYINHMNWDRSPFPLKNKGTLIGIHHPCHYTRATPAIPIQPNSRTESLYKPPICLPITRATYPFRLLTGPHPIWDSTMVKLVSGDLDSLWCRAFPSHHVWSDQQRFSSLPPKSIETFTKLTNNFLNYFTSGHCHKKYVRCFAQGDDISSTRRLPKNKTSMRKLHLHSPKDWNPS